jgi:hypothetical protein
LINADGQRGGRDPEREVHEEDPVPVDGLGDHAAGQHADRRARGARERVAADGPGPQRRLGEHRRDHPEHHGRGHRAADALDEPRGDQHGLVAGQAAPQRRRGEHGQPGDEDPLAAAQVAEPPGQQEQAAERYQVRVDHPGQARLGEAEVPLDGRQRHGDDRAVQDRHQRAGAEHDQRQPARVPGRRGRSGGHVVESHNKNRIR